jgi:hypothetical protein
LVPMTSLSNYASDRSRPALATRVVFPTRIMSRGRQRGFKHDPGATQRRRRQAAPGVC